MTIGIDLEVPLGAWQMVGFPAGDADLNGTRVMLREATSAPRVSLVVDSVVCDPGVDNLRTGDVDPAGAVSADTLGLVAVDHLMVRTRDAEVTLSSLSRAFGVAIDTDANGERTVTVDGVRIDMVPTPDLPVAAEVWGIAFRVTDIDRVAARLGGEVLGAAKTARQVGQRVAVFRGAAALGVPTALIDLRG
jgi:hypothetical protein